MSIEHINKDLIATFGGLEEILKLPILKVSSRYGRDYIDYIEYDDVSVPIMRGIDNCDRFFIVFKFKFVSAGQTKYITEVLFQRYTAGHLWTSASNPPGIYSILGKGGILYYDKIKELLLTGKLVNMYNQYTNQVADYIIG